VKTIIADARQFLILWVIAAAGAIDGEIPI
jgi:hypothetical protein